MEPTAFSEMSANKHYVWVIIPKLELIIQTVAKVSNLGEPSILVFDGEISREEIFKT
jgi:hypothetical protein